MSLIKDIKIKKILDSRGEPTIEVSITTDGTRYFSASVPSGKSRGKGEASVLSFDRATFTAKKIKEHINHIDFRSVTELDDTLKILDGTKDKSVLGGNVMLGISVAYTRLMAFERNKELWQVLQDEFFGEVEEKKPLVFSNLINGGSHTKSNLSIQEYMVVLKTSGSFSQSIEKLEFFYKTLGEKLQFAKKQLRLSLGDEGGYALNFRDNFEPIEILQKTINETKTHSYFDLALDCAASSFFSKKKYKFDGKAVKSIELLSTYKKYFDSAKSLLSIEDPFEETDEEDFKNLNQILKNKWVVGDDITVTDPVLIEKYAKFGSINAVIIKPNQIGLVSEACEAIKTAHEHGVKTIVSHRSGETEDSFIIHLAKAGGVDAVKIGAPVRERVLKFNELVRIYG